jgi:hypothetical protein
MLTRFDDSPIQQLLSGDRKVHDRTRFNAFPGR